MNRTATNPRLSQESITILSVGGALLGTAVALGALILNTTGRIEHRIERVEDRLLAVEKETASLRVEVERVVEQMFAVEKETSSLRVDFTELRAGLEREKAAAAGTATVPPPSRG